MLVQFDRTAIGFSVGFARPLRNGHLTIVDRYLLPGRPIETASDPGHLRMTPLSFGEIFHLACEVSGVEPRQPRNEVAVTLSVQAVTGRASSACTRIAAAESDYLAAILPDFRTRMALAARR